MGNIIDTSRIPFKPVRGTEEHIQTMTTENGSLYFATDSRKTYLGLEDGGDKLLMGNDIGVYYGTKEIPADNSGNPLNPTVYFSIQEIEGDRLPLKDDLILNVDGCFYRVDTVVDASNVKTTRLTLQGSGTGGGNTGGGGGSSFNISFSNPSKQFVFSSEAESMDIGIISYYNGTDDNFLSAVSFFIGTSTEPFYTVTTNKDGEPLEFNKTHLIDLIDYKDKFGETNTIVKVAIYDKYGVDRSDEIKIRMVTIALEQKSHTLLYTTTDSLEYACNLSGATAGVTNKQLIFKLYKESTPNVLDEEIIKPLLVSDEGDIPAVINVSAKEHGVYILKVQACATITGTTNTIYSNELTHKFAKYAEGGDPLLMVLAPEKTEQYTNIDIAYLFVTNESGAHYTLDIKLNNQSHKSLDIQSNTLGSYTFYFEDKGTYEALFTVVEVGVFKSISLYITGYTGNLPVIDATRDDLMLYLTPRGKTNTEVNRAQWEDYNGRYTATLSGLHYGASDGWLMDAHGTSYLKLTSGATLQLPTFKPFAHDLTKADQYSSGLGLTIELDFEINGILDYDVSTISCVSYKEDGVTPTCGFEVIGDKVKMYNNRLNGKINPATGKLNGVLANQTIVEGKRMRLSFVIEPQSQSYPLCYTYLNGKISGATKYTVGIDEFKDGYYPATLNIDSSAAQVKIYGIRFYSNALKDNVILNNYTATFSSLEERQENYATNKVLDAKNNVSFALVADEEYNLQIPYMKLTGGYKSISKDEKWQLAEPANMKAGLPTGKKDYRHVDVEIVYPTYAEDEDGFFKGYNNYSFFNTYEKDGKPLAMKDAGGLKPTNGGMIMYAQGTSSMEYPIKNLRLRAKKEKNFFTVKPDITPVEIICMKADYMESSGSHNTGTANFVDELYQSAHISTPGQSQFGAENKRIVTCIKGHPCLIFYSADPAGPYEYVGKYNLNLDKATPEPFGFNHADDFGWLDEGEEYWAVQYGTENEDTGEWEEVFIGQAEPTEGADYIPGQSEQKKTVQAGEKINSIHCFEFLDNAVKVCNFLNRQLENTPKEEETLPSENSIYTLADDVDPEKFKPGVLYIKNDDGKYEPAQTYDPEQTYYRVHFNYEETWYNTVWDTKEKRYAPGWTLGFESRYPEDRLGYHDADMLWPLASWLHELYNIRYGLEGMDADPALALARFKNEYECYLNKDFLLAYYLITEALLMADSRVKNMMIATWGKARKSYQPLKQEGGKWVVDKSATPVETNNYIFYPIFYDMDTMLGLDNTGAARFNYYDEDTDPAVYNGDEVLWNFVRDALPTELITYYNKLEDGLLNADDILPYYNNNQANMANEAFYNGDAKYKYINPFRTGYRDDLNEKDIKPGEAPYLYAAQGDRSLMRESFIQNRIRFLRGKYASDKFQKNDRIVYRQNCPASPAVEPVLGDNPTEVEREALSAYHVPSDGIFRFTSLKTGYAGVNLGANGGLSVERFDGEETKNISIDTSSASGTEAYLLGLSTLSDMGDLSNKYMQKFIMESSDIRLKKLILGSPNKYYYNRYWNVTVGGQSPEITLGGYNEETHEPYGCLYLEEFNLQNCAAFNNALDFSVCSAIEKIYLTGSGVSGVILPTNGLLTELRLPTGVTLIKIEGHGNLTDRGFSVGTYDYNGRDNIGEYTKVGRLTREEFEANADIYFINKGTEEKPDYEFAPKEYRDTYEYYTEVGSYVDDFSHVEKLYIVDTPINTYRILQEASGLTDYYLENVEWNINAVESDKYCRRDSSWTYIAEDGSTKTLAEKVPAGYYQLKDGEYQPYESEQYPERGYLFEKFSMLDGNKLVCIPTLEWLQTKAVMKGTKHAEALSGTININLPKNGDKGIEVVELDIYERYADIFPNITITYGENMDVEGASRIEFYRIDTETMSQMNIADAQPYFFSLTAEGANSLKSLVNVKAFVNPVKNATVGLIYTFTGRWKEWGTNNFYYQDVKEQAGFKKEEGDILFSEYYPKTPMKLVPVFAVSTRQYLVTLYDNDGTTELVKTYIDYESDIGEYFEVNWNTTNPTYSRAFYNYHEYINEAKPDYRWAFKGWQSAADWKAGNTEASYSYLKGRKVTSDIVFYAFYKEENINANVTMVASVTDYFDFNAGVISLKDKFRGVLQGKITLPIVDGKGAAVKTIGNFSCKNADGTVVPTLFTHVYVKDKDTAQYEAIDTNAFSHTGQNSGVNNPSALTYIELPPSLTTIGKDSFINCHNLQTVVMHDNVEQILGNVFWNAQNISSFGVDNLPKNLIELGGSSLYNAGDNLIITALPENLTEINAYALSAGEGVNIATFGSATKPITKMAGSALTGSGNGSITKMTIYCAAPYSTAGGKQVGIAPDAFKGYAVNVSELTVYSASNTISKEEIASWGIQCVADVNIVTGTI